MTQAPLEVWQSSDEVCQTLVCMSNGNEVIAQRVLPSVPVNTTGLSLDEKVQMSELLQLCVRVMEGCTG